jgi:PIN domain nuclease of toxin-antitoxin system
VKLLLDTCVALWLFAGSERIPRTLADRLRDPRRRLFFSDVSLLEVVLKYRAGRLPLPAPPSRLIPDLAARHRLDPLPLGRGAILRLEKIEGRHGDPFDRLLVAQALEHGMALVTPDALIRQYAVRTLWD